jgi:release factor glutamine methyltransferase
MMTIKTAIAQLVQALAPLYDARESRSIADLYLQHLTSMRRIDLLVYSDRELDAAQQESLATDLPRLAAATPLQYVLGEAWFGTLQLEVNPAVLIPRPETEELCEWITASVKETGNENSTILDIGTGSGCIPLYLKQQLPGATVSAWDISVEALDTARRNALRNHLEVAFELKDALQPGTLSANQYDVIVSNPPYITLAEKTQIHANVLDHEPHLALFVTNNDPQQFYKAVHQVAQTALRPGGLLFFETHADFGADTETMLRDTAAYTEVALRNDMHGNPRMIRAIKK